MLFLIKISNTHHMKDLTEQEIEILRDLGKLLVFKTSRDGMPPPNYLAKEAKAIQQATGINEERLQTATDFLYLQSMKMSFQTDHSPVGFKTSKN
jgi:hypothetical protein